MRILPLMYLETLDDAEIARHSCSDRIWMHQTQFQTWISTDAGIVTLIKLENSLEQSVIGCVFGVHQGDPETLYVPQWMYDMLDFDTESIELERETPSMCTGIVLQPHTSDHIHVADPQEFLRDGFEQYSVLTPGQTLDLWVGDDDVGGGIGAIVGGGKHRITCTILQLLPVNETLAIRNCEMTLELMVPLDTPIPPVPVHVPEPEPSPEVEVEREQPVQPVTEEDPAVRRQRMAEAARARLLPPLPPLPLLPLLPTLPPLPPLPLLPTLPPTKK